MKEKWVILIAIALVLLFASEITAEASASDYSASHKKTLITTFQMPSATRNYKFNIGADGIYVNNSNVTVSYATGTAHFTFDTGSVASKVVSLSGNYDYDYNQFVISPDIYSTFTLVDNGFDAYTSYSNIRPYVVVDGVKYYMDNGIQHSIVIDPISGSSTAYIGAEVDVVVSFDGKSISEDFVKTFFGTANYYIIFHEMTCEYFGMKYISTGDSAVIGSLSDIKTSFIDYFISMDDSLAMIASNIDVKLTSFMKNVYSYIVHNATLITTAMSEWKDLLSEQMTNWQSSLDSKLDEVIDAITKSYGTDKADKIKDDIESTLEDMEVADSQLREDAVGNLDNFTIPTDGFDSFSSGFISAFGFVSSMLQSIYSSSGGFNVIISVVFMITITSMCLGLFRYYMR